MRRRVHLALLAGVFVLASCGTGSEGDLTIAFIDSPEGMFATDLRLSSGARHIRAATEAGLVSLNAQGEVIPGLADRWIVTDDGLSFIFRLREGTWPDGSELTAESVRAELARIIRQLEGTALGLEFAPIDEVRAMAGRVIEIRLSSPVPTLLQLLAQPELALTKGAGGTGDMLLQQRDRSAVLFMKPPAQRGLPEEEDWSEHVRPLLVHADAAQEAIKKFDDGEVDIVLGGGLGAWPLADTGPLSRGTVQIDPALGLFGLQVQRERGLLSEAEGREALAMAIDRPALVGPFNIGGWVPTSRVIPPNLPGYAGERGERWGDAPIDERRAIAVRRVAAWMAANDGAEARISLSLGESPGLDLLYRQLAGQFATIGVVLERVSEDQPADLVLVDSVARHASARWFLNQFHCSLERGLCSSRVDLLVEGAADVADADARAVLMAQAETELTRTNVYIPFGQPLRWSLVRSGIDAFVANQWAFHPLPPLAQRAR